MKNESKGLGDSVEKVLKATGIDKVAKFLLGEDCGCDERKEKLNKLFPYAKPKCLTEDEHDTLSAYFKQSTNTLTIEQQSALIAINNRVFDQGLTLSTCSSCVMDLVNKMRILYNEYSPEQNEETIVKQ